jgi:hypothetical protein
MGCNLAGYVSALMQASRKLPGRGMM